MSPAFRYKYYLLGNTTPIRVTLNADGLRLGAASPDARRKRLVLDATLLSRLDQSWEVEEIDRDAVEGRCVRVYGNFH